MSSLEIKMGISWKSVNAGTVVPGSYPWRHVFENIDSALRMAATMMMAAMVMMVVASQQYHFNPSGREKVGSSRVRKLCTERTEADSSSSSPLDGSHRWRVAAVGTQQLLRAAADDKSP